MIPDETELISRLKNGDRHAFETLVKELLPQVYSIVLGIIRNKEDAEDVTQEVFIKVHRSVKKFRNTTGISSWIYKIAYNKAIDQYRKNHKQKFEPIDNHPNIADMSKHQYEHLADTELKQTLYYHIDRLPDMQRTVLLFRIKSHLTFKEIAALLNRSVGTIKANYFHAIEKLRRALRKEEADGT